MDGVEAKSLAEFLLPMMCLDPAKRCTAAEALLHPWLAAADEEEIFDDIGRPRRQKASQSSSPAVATSREEKGEKKDSNTAVAPASSAVAAATVAPAAAAAIDSAAILAPTPAAGPSNLPSEGAPVVTEVIPSLPPSTLLNPTR
jgi:serine/threonine protein kinase